MTINFGAGPSKVPPEVLRQAQREFLDFDGLGISITEMSHRSPTFSNIMQSVEKDVRELLNVPDDYAVLLMHGGGVGQMSAVPLNLCTSRDSSVVYLVNGYWSEKAAKEAAKYCQVTRVTESSFTQVPVVKSSDLTQDPKYVYYCDNETIHGVEFDQIPDCGPIPLVCDMTSNLFTRPVDVSKFGCIFAGTQKNAGIASLTIVIVRKNLIKPLDITPIVLDYKVTMNNGSLQNTPSCFAVYITSLCLQLLKKNGGLEEMSRRSIAKSSLLYDIIDSSEGFYHNPVSKKFRSRVTVPFRVGGKAGNPDLEKKFLQEAEALSMIQLKGHRSVGGIRASLYNAITIEEVTVLANFMADFRKRYA